MVIVSRTANMIQQPFTGSLLDLAPTSHKLEFVEQQFRIIISGSTVGTLLGMILFPTFIALFSRSIIHLKNSNGSIPIMIKNQMQMNFFKRIVKHLHFPNLSNIKELNIKSISFNLFMINMIITSVYTMGVLAALYAALIAPERHNTAIMASGLINGIATILLVVFVDPKLSVIADKVCKENKGFTYFKNITGMMVISRFCGTILAQLFFIPSAFYIAWFTKFIV